MTTYNTAADAANTMIRAFLTKVGESYLGHSFNTGSGKGKEHWQRIITETFNSHCAFCDKEEERLTIEHLVMFNREQCGLHHPGNIVPCCKDCNKRGRNPEERRYFDLNKQLKSKCNSEEELEIRKQRIQNHIENENYPRLTEDEINALRAVAMHLSDATSSELDKALKLYKEIDRTLVKKRNN